METTAATEIVVEPTESTAPTESTEAVVVIDYTPVLLDCTTTLANIILSGALMIVGVLCAFKLWEVKIK